ncbi:senescence-specific cysteine protease SAG39-like [Trifolium pratense]|uniref:senescence-specific cysteine protease SAG39-like n=1 Tax=Trifolium pratense TaxID=57577 RepID=UPI001E69557A|nr:senescence-specific cysteine protease SAG39-like [Trifolium pratense]
MLLRFFSSGFRSIKGAVDWRKKGALAPVKNQGCSGVCTLMACIASIESIFQIKSPSGDLIELSSQHMLNCIARQYSRHKGVSGPRIDAVIDGINEVDIFKFAITKGIPTEKAFPYKEVSEAIKSIKDPLHDFKEKYFIDTYQWIRERSTKDGGASG